jgi:hypothetical protein
MLISYAKRFRDWLHGLAAEYKKQIAQQPDPDHATVQVNSSPPVTNILHVSDATIDRIKEKSKEDKRRRRFKDTVETITLGVVVVYTFFAWANWHELNTQNIHQSAATISAGATADRGATQSVIALHADQRAWLMTSYRPEEIGVLLQNRLHESFTMQNIGKTPVVKMRGIAVLKLLDNTQVPKFGNLDKEIIAFQKDQLPIGKNNASDSRGFYGGILFPNIPKTIPVESGIIAPEEYAKYPSTAYIVLYGTITYEDVFGHHHWTHFCTFESNSPAQSALDKRGKCADYNGVDRDIE